jgi:hypothetical protein
VGRGGIIVFVVLLVAGLGAGAWYYYTASPATVGSATPGATQVTIPPAGPSPTAAPEAAAPPSGAVTPATAAASGLGTAADPIIPKDAQANDIPFPPECVVPGPPPVMPRGAVATLDDMKVAHAAIQGFVKALEAYQACLEKHIVNDTSSTTPQIRQVWRTAGNRAVDAATMLANGYSHEYQIYKARQPTPATSP